MIDIHHYFHIPVEPELEAKLDKIATFILSLKELIIMDNAQLIALGMEVKATLIKVGKEIDAFKTSAAADTASLQTAIAGLEAELGNASGISPAAEAMLSDIRTLSTALDGKIEDLPALQVDQASQT